MDYSVVNFTVWLFVRRTVPVCNRRHIQQR